MNLQKNICIAFLGNAMHDSRITNLSKSLHENGCTVTTISFDWNLLQTDYDDGVLKIFKLAKNKFRLLFYLRFARLLISELMKSPAEIFFAEDIYTLPFVVITAKLKKAKVYYNSRELYAFLAGLRNRPWLQYVIKTIEKYFIKKVDLVLTTGEMDSEFLEKFYNITNTLVIRNIPLFQKPQNKINYREKYGISADKIILLYQGVLLEGRGISVVMQLMVNCRNTVLIILGDGEQKKNFQALSEKLQIADRIFFVGTINQKELINYTAGADVGLALIENISISYYHALPNKLFEYIMAEVPVFASNLPQMKAIVDAYQVGVSVDLENKSELETQLNNLLDDEQRRIKYKANCKTAAMELNWEKEISTLLHRIAVDN